MKIEPVIVQDTREQCPLPITAFPVEVCGLPVGDYSVKGFHSWENPGIAIERKSLEDLCHSLGKGRERFLREVEKLRQFRFRGLVIEAVKDQVELAQYRSLISPASVLATLDALSVRAGLHIYWCDDPPGAARQVESLVRQFTRGILKDARRLAGANYQRVGNLGSGAREGQAA